MNDNDIIKALGCCISCSECPYYKWGDRCVKKRDADIINLINRQKAEIAELKQRIEVLETEDELRRERDVALKED